MYFTVKKIKICAAFIRKYTVIIFYPNCFSVVLQDCLQEDQVTREQGYTVDPLRLDMTAQVKPAL